MESNREPLWRQRERLDWIDNQEREAGPREAWVALVACLGLFAAIVVVCAIW